MALIAVRDPGGNFVCRGTEEPGSRGAGELRSWGAGGESMTTDLKELTKRAVDELPEDETAEVLDFIGYLRWRREEMDQTWFWTEEWQERYREAKADLAEGRFQEFDDIEGVLADLKSQPETSG
jgi:uncharacterized membrane-anchored protein